jgi:hypothetical protein
VVSPEVSDAVDAPGEVEHTAVPEGAGHPHCWPEVFAPTHHCNVTREKIRHVKGEPRVEALLEHHKRVRLWAEKKRELKKSNADVCGANLEVRIVELFSCLCNKLVLLDKQPPHVCEEEPSCGVVRVGISFRVLVVHTVVAGPVKN